MKKARPALIVLAPILLAIFYIALVAGIYGLINATSSTSPLSDLISAIDPKTTPLVVPDDATREALNRPALSRPEDLPATADAFWYITPADAPTLDGYAFDTEFSNPYYRATKYVIIKE